MHRRVEKKEEQKWMGKLPLRTNTELTSIKEMHFKWHCYSFSPCTQWEFSVWAGQNRSAQCHVQGESAKSHCSSLNTEAPAFPARVQLLNGPVLAAQESRYSGVNSHNFMCLHKIKKSTKYTNILSTTDTLEIAFCPSQTESENTARVSAEKHRGLQEMSSCQTWYLSLSLLGDMQIIRGCEVFVLVINSWHPCCARTILATLPLMSIFIKYYLAQLDTAYIPRE